MKELGLLLTSAGRRNQLLECFRGDAAALGIRLRLLAVDLNPTLSPACQAADAAFAVPRCTAPEYVDELLDLCRRERIDLIVPTIDPELGVLSRAAGRFESIGVTVVVSVPRVVTVANDKAGTAALLAASGLPVPRTLSLAELRERPSALNWPVIVRPNAGSASVGVRILAEAGAIPEDLDSAGMVAQEYWQGAEYTVNVYFSPDGKLQCAIPHERIEVRAGEVSKGRTARVPCLMEAAEYLAAALPGARGPLCFQAIVRPDGRFVVFEINARFGGGFPLAHRAGGHFTRWLLEERLGRRPAYSSAWREGVLMLRYDAAVYLDG